jgi:hypothetical protein
MAGGDIVDNAGHAPDIVGPRPRFSGERGTGREGSVDVGERVFMRTGLASPNIEPDDLAAVRHYTTRSGIAANLEQQITPVLSDRSPYALHQASSGRPGMQPNPNVLSYRIMGRDNTTAHVHRGTRWRGGRPLTFEQRRSLMRRRRRLGSKRKIKLHHQHGLLLLCTGV